MGNKAERFDKTVAIKSFEYDYSDEVKEDDLTDHVAYMEGIRNACVILIGDLERKRPLRPLRCEYGINMYLRGCELNSPDTRSDSRTSG